MGADYAGHAFDWFGFGCGHIFYSLAEKSGSIHGLGWAALIYLRYGTTPIVADCDLQFRFFSRVSVFS